MNRKPRGQTREAVYQFVQERVRAGSPPTIREVQHALGLKAVESARTHLESLVAEGKLLKETGKSRGFSIPGLQPRTPVREIPLLGRVQAGALHAAIEHPDSTISVEDRGTHDELFALRIQGESMRDAGILHGDIVVVRKQPTAHAGDIVVALVEDEATVKRLKLKRKRIELWPENPAFEPIIPDPEAVSILGKVVEVRRYL
jgi:repressor LexA